MKIPAESNNCKQTPVSNDDVPKCINLFSIDCDNSFTEAQLDMAAGQHHAPIGPSSNVKTTAELVIALFILFLWG